VSLGRRHSDVIEPDILLRLLRWRPFDVRQNPARAGGGWRLESKQPCLADNVSWYPDSFHTVSSMGCCPMAPVYLEDFTVCKPPDQWLVDWDKLMEGTYEWKVCCSRAIATGISCF